MFGIGSDLQKKHLGRHSMKISEDIEGLAPEQYGNRASKEADIKDLNTRLLYNIIQLKRLPNTIVFAYLVSNCDLVLQSIAYLLL